MKNILKILFDFKKLSLLPRDIGSTPPSGNRTLKMPKKSNLAKKNAAVKKNRAAATDALDGKEAIVGYVNKALGNGAFTITLKGGKEVTGLIRGVLKGGRNSAAYIVPGAWVILEENSNKKDPDEVAGVAVLSPQARPLMQEILGVVSDRKTFKQLMAAGLIEERADEKDDGFIFEHDESAEMEDAEIDEI